MRAPLPLIALSTLLALAGCTIVDDTRPAVGGVTGPADPSTYLKPVAKPTPATRDAGLVPQAGASADPAPAAPAPTPVAVEADPAAPSGAEPEEEGEDAEVDGDAPADDEEAEDGSGGV